MSSSRFLAFVLLVTVALTGQAQTTSEELAVKVHDLHQQGAFDGVVIIVDGDRKPVAAAYGLAHRGHGVDTNLETRFNTASMYKMFTAVAIMQLYEQGKLSLDDSVDKWLDSQWLPAEVSAKIKVRHLLSHTSGLGSYWGPAYENTSKLNFMQLDDYKSLISGELAFEPGSDWQYSNTGFLLLGVIIEEISGISYFDYTEKHIFTPAGMTRTGCYRLDRPVDNLAIGYFEEDGQIFNNTFLHVARGGPAGGGYTTAGDMIRFAHALWGNTLLSADTFAMMTVDQSNGNGYGFGFAGEGPATGHNGGFPGISCVFIMSEEPGKAVILLSNFGSVRSLMRPARSFVTGKEMPSSR